METALTEYEVIKIFPKLGIAKVRINLKTGRTHQIRLHFDSICHPLVGETLYINSFNVNTMKKYNKLKHQALWATELEYELNNIKKRLTIK